MIQNLLLVFSTFLIFSAKASNNSPEIPQTPEHNKYLTVSPFPVKTQEETPEKVFMKRFGILVEKLQNNPRIRNKIPKDEDLRAVKNLRDPPIRNVLKIVKRPKIFGQLDNETQGLFEDLNRRKNNFDIDRLKNQVRKHFNERGLLPTFSEKNEGVQLGLIVSVKKNQDEIKYYIKTHSEGAKRGFSSGVTSFMPEEVFIYQFLSGLGYTPPTTFIQRTEKDVYILMRDAEWGTKEEIPEKGKFFIYEKRKDITDERVKDKELYTYFAELYFLTKLLNLHDTFSNADNYGIYLPDTPKKNPYLVIIDFRNLESNEVFEPIELVSSFSNDIAIENSRKQKINQEIFTEILDKFLAKKESMEKQRERQKEIYNLFQKTRSETIAFIQGIREGGTFDKQSKDEMLKDFQAYIQKIKDNLKSLMKWGTSQ